MSGDARHDVSGRVVGPPLEDADVAELDELARDERAEEHERALEGGPPTLPLVEAPRETSAVSLASTSASDAPTLARGETTGAAEGDTVVVELGAPPLGAEGEGAIEVPDERPAVAPPETFLLLRFVEVAMVLPSTNPVLVLEEAVRGGRELRIPIGTPEGVAIAYAARQLRTPRPLTHELTIALLETYNITIETARITAVRGSAFEAEVVCAGPGGMRTLPCRPSDAVALALRQRLPAPIVCIPWVLEQAGTVPARRR